MADQSDVEAALLALISSAIYPAGPSSGSTVSVDCRIYRGWPNSSALDSDLRAGLANVTVFPTPDSGQVTTRHLPIWQATPAAVTLMASVSGNTVTISGTPSAGQVAGLLVDQRAYAYAVQATDTPASVAANLASQARPAIIVQQSGATITIPGAYSLKARVVAQAQATSQIRRQRHDLRVTCWCPSPNARDAIATAIDQAFALVRFIPLPDGTEAHLTYRGTTVLDQSQDALLYRRDLVYSLEYPTIVTQAQPAMLWGQLGLGAAEVLA